MVVNIEFSMLKIKMENIVDSGGNPQGIGSNWYSSTINKVKEIDGFKALRKDIQALEKRKGITLYFSCEEAKELCEPGKRFHFAFDGRKFSDKENEKIQNSIANLITKCMSLVKNRVKQTTMRERGTRDIFTCIGDDCYCPLF